MINFEITKKETTTIHRRWQDWVLLGRTANTEPMSMLVYGATGNTIKIGTLYGIENRNMQYGTSIPLANFTFEHRYTKEVVDKICRMHGAYLGVDRFIPFIKSSAIKGATKITFKARIQTCEYGADINSFDTRCVAHIGVHRIGETLTVKGVPIETLTASSISEKLVGTAVPEADVEEGKYYPIVEWVEFLDPVYHYTTLTLTDEITPYTTHPSTMVLSLTDFTIWFDSFCQTCNFEVFNNLYSTADVIAAFVNDGGVWDD